MEIFKSLPVLHKTTAERVKLPDIAIKKGMEEYSGWKEREHLQWIEENTKLNFVQLSLLVEEGYLVFTDEDCSQVWLLSQDYWKSTCRLLYKD